MVIVNDLGLAAYIKGIKKIPLAKEPDIGENGIFRFYFNISEEEKKKYFLEYIHSDFSLFDKEIKNLRRLLYSLSNSEQSKG